MAKIGIFTKDDLASTGPVTAMIRLEHAGIKPGINMLYALVGALEGEHWQEVARLQKGELLLALDAARELDKL
ncbi:TfoX/Sxy family DNA transformation protein [Shewanella sp. UCD-KL12]|uniref:TfoX/Sxy family DNA transformation protein n=1 Tax=Shewanella sp. UCD-KL12 TaxID=1917163 RepID=UPI0009FB0A3F|nr:TfoX/Sxy family DNA transformation protein [Shewanella sp. UCD-KL12]